MHPPNRKGLGFVGPSISVRKAGMRLQVMRILLEIFSRPTRRLFLVAIGCGVLIGVAPVGLLASQNVELTWNPSPNVDVIGYNVYYGTESGVYPFLVNVDNVTATQIYGLEDGLTYYFAVSASDSKGDESVLSEEVFYTVPVPAPLTLQTQILTDENGQPNYLAITATDTETQWWQLEYSTDLQTWSFFTFGYGSDMFVLASLTDEAQPQMFFRLVKY